MQIAVVSVFPQMFSLLRDYGVVGKAVTEQQLMLSCWNPRDQVTSNYQSVDDRPYGGGPGMVMLVEPIAKSLAQARQALLDGQPNGKARTIKTVYLSPQGKQFNQMIAQSVADRSEQESLVLLAGRYEGVDERLITQEVDEEWSIGDYVLSGGELAAMVVVDAVARLLPGVLGHALSAQQDSFVDGLLDYPHYTRPAQYAGLEVPEVLLSGNHELIRRWRLQQSLGRTWLRRPDLLAQRALNQEETELLQAFIQEHEA